MSEYVLFDEALRDRFVQFVQAKNLNCEMRADAVAGYVIQVPDDLPEDIEDALEEEYDTLMEQQQDMVESAEGSVDRTLMAVEAVLADGRQLSICLPAVYARRLYEHFSLDEIRDLVTTIAQEAVEPQSGSMCCRASG